MDVGATNVCPGRFWYIQVKPISERKGCKGIPGKDKLKLVHLHVNGDYLEKFGGRNVEFVNQNGGFNT